MNINQFEQLSNLQFWKTLIDQEPFFDQFSKLVLHTVKETAFVLPTSKETAALPFLEILGDSLIDLLEQSKYLEIYQLIHPHRKIMVLVFIELFQGTVEAVFRGKLYNEKKIVQSADIIFIKLVELCSRLISSLPEAENEFVLSVLSTILDKQKDFYKNVGKESISTHPFGEPLFPSGDKKVWVEETLNEGMKVDCVRVKNGQKLWVRGLYLKGSSPAFCKVRYEADGTEGFLNNKYMEVAPLGTFTEDESWRDQLKEGDYIDLYSLNNKWGLAQIEKVERVKLFISSEVETHKGWANDSDNSEDNEEPAGYWSKF
jgi:hypothetical protein